MKTRLLIISIILCACGQFLTAQDTITREMIYKSTMRILSDPSFDYQGDLYEVNGSSISLSSICFQNYYSGNHEKSGFPAGNFNFIQTQKPLNGKKETWKEVASGIACAVLFEVLTDNGF